MGSSTQQNKKTNREMDETAASLPSLSSLSSLSLELLEKVSDESKAAMVHDSSRPICYVRPPSLQECLLHRDKYLPERALALANDAKERMKDEGTAQSNSSSTSAAGEKQQTKMIMLQTFYKSCLNQCVEGEHDDILDILTTYRDELKAMKKESK